MSSKDTQNLSSSQESLDLRKHLLKDHLEARLFLSGNPLVRKMHKTILSAENISDRPPEIDNSPVGFDSTGESIFCDENSYFRASGELLSEAEIASYFLIHGNNSSTTHKQGLDSPFDDFNPDYSSSIFDDRLTRYAKAHSRAVDMGNFIRLNVPLNKSIATQLSECGSYLVFHHYHTINEIKLAAMCSCKIHLLCPLCAIRRAAKTVKVYMEKYNLLVQGNQHLKAYLVTFTVKDGEDLNERFEHLQKSLRKYHDHRRKYLNSKSKTRHLPNEACKALGGVGSFEIKKGLNSGIWHPHAHFIWLCESVPDVDKIRSEWQEITSDSFIVDVTPFYDQEKVSEGFLEVFKYALKTSSMTLEDNWEAYTILQRRRLVSSFGIFYGLEIPEQMTDEISYDELPYIELVYRYFYGSYKKVMSIDQQGNEQSE